jgi:hypothetical protein
MDAKLLTEKGWADVAKKFKISDTNLQKALAAYEKIADDNHNDRLKAINEVLKVIGNVKKVKEVAMCKEATKYLNEVLGAAALKQKELLEAIKKTLEAKAAAAKPASPPKPDPNMLLDALQAGLEDGFNGVPSRRKLFAKAPPFQAKYDQGYDKGLENRAKGPQTSMKPISKEDWDKSVQYTKRKKLRKEFIQYLNQWWDTRLPENM